MSGGPKVMIGVEDDAVLYGALPLYHTAGGMLGAGMTLTQGLTMVIRKKFSASNYFKDCAKYNCTVSATAWEGTSSWAYICRGASSH